MSAESGRDSTDLVSRSIGNVTIRIATKASALSDIWTAISQGRGRIYAFCNAHTVGMARMDLKLCHALQAATVFNDGVGVDIASRLLYGQRFPDNLNGTDLVPAVLSGLQERTRVFIVGSPPGIAEIAAQNLMRRFTMVDVVGIQHGFFDTTDNADVVNAIRHSNAQLILIGMGHPRQEVWANEIVDKVDAVILCVGAFIDFASGRVKRAPSVVRRLRSEWLYRLCLEPNRLFKRYTIGTAIFFKIIAAQKIK